MLFAPHLGRILYARLGFRAPFIMGIIVSFLDLVFRLLLIEPGKSTQVDVSIEKKKQAVPHNKLSREKDAAEKVGETVYHSSFAIIWVLLRSPRAMVACVDTFVYG